MYISFLDVSKVPLISELNPLKTLKFLHNVDKYHRLQFLSNRDPVKSCSKPGRSMIYLQGDKKNIVNKKDSLLPKLTVK